MASAVFSSHTVVGVAAADAPHDGAAGASHDGATAGFARATRCFVVVCDAGRPCEGTNRTLAEVLLVAADGGALHGGAGASHGGAAATGMVGRIRVVMGQGIEEEDRLVLGAPGVEVEVKVEVRLCTGGRSGEMDGV